MRDTIKMGVILMGVCFIAAALLSLVYGVTSKQIAENERIANELKRKLVMPQAAVFKETELDGKTFYAAYDDKDVMVGAVLKATPQGYGGLIKITVGVDNDGSISAIEIMKLDQQETPGLGAKVVKPRFKDQFKGKRVKALKVKQDGGEIDAVTAATISSRAATNGIREELEWFLENKN